MQIILRPRRAGKNTELIDLLREDTNRMLLTYTLSEAIRLQEKYPEIKDRIMTWMEYIKPEYYFPEMKRDKELYVNDEFPDSLMNTLTIKEK